MQREELIARRVAKDAAERQRMATPPNVAMRRGLWNIPIPPVRKVVEPNVLVVPLVGFDSAHYRLGYGGGFLDRRLAVATRRPHIIGVGYTDAPIRKPSSDVRARIYAQRTSGVPPGRIDKVDDAREYCSLAQPIPSLYRHVKYRIILYFLRQVSTQ